MADYLAQFGIVTKTAEVTLTGAQNMLQADIIKLMQLIDKHYSYWEQTASKQTVMALVDARVCLRNLLDALHRPANRVEHLCAAIYNRDLVGLMLAIRTPVASRRRENNQEFKDFRAIVVADRNTFRNGIIAILEAMKPLVVEHNRDPAFAQFLGASPELVGQFLEAHIVHARAADENDAIEDIDMIELEAPPSPPAGLYN